MLELLQSRSLQAAILADGGDHSSTRRALPAGPPRPMVGLWPPAVLGCYRGHVEQGL